MRKTTQRRWGYLIALAVVIAIGLLSRRISFLPNETGDALWAIALFCLFRIIWCKELLRKIALWTLLTSYAVEFSQLLQWNWLVTIRSTTIGHLLLGQGFLWSDILAYTIGVIIAFAITTLIERSSKT